MFAIEGFTNPDNSKFARWVYGGKIIDISNQGRVIALLKKDSRVLIVHIDRAFGRNNAFIYSAGGSVEKKIAIPEAVSEAICFDDAYYDGEDLTLIAASKERRVACVINENGDVVRMHEVR